MSSPSKEDRDGGGGGGNTITTTTTKNDQGGLLPVWVTGRLDEYLFGAIRRFYTAAIFYFRNLWTSLLHGHFGALFGRENHELHERSFAQFYQMIDHQFAAYEATTVAPSLVASAHGLVLDVGPGTGNQLDRFDARRVGHVYGVEPNAAFRERFLARLRGTPLGADGKYTLLNPARGLADGDVLARAGVAEGSMDCVVCMQVMCSLPNLEEQIRLMHRLLKPGGQLIFWEHCRNTNREARLVQGFWSLFWPFAFGGCRLDRVTRDVVVGAADWAVVEVAYEAPAPAPYTMMPRLYGRLVKGEADEAV